MNSHRTNSTEIPTPQSAEALTQQAEIYLAEGKLADAITACQAALDLDSTWAAGYVTMGTIKHAQGDIDGAIALYAQAIELNPDSAPAYANLGSMLYKKSRFQEAISNYRKALNLNPNLVAVHLNLANALKQQGQLTESAQHQEKALSLNPEYAQVDALIKQGDELAKSGKLEDAIRLWEKALSIKPDLAEVYCQIGIMRRFQGKYKEALDVLQKALQLKPDYIAAHQHLCGILRDTTNYAEARKAVNTYYQTCGEVDRIMTTLYVMSTYHLAGLNQVAKDRFLELETLVKQTIRSWKKPYEIKALYANLLFSMPYFRDDVESNSQLNQLVAQQYIKQVLHPSQLEASYPPKQRQPESELRLGFISSHFNRHSVGWCSFDIIEALRKITSQVYLYATEPMRTDDFTQWFAKTAQLYIPQNYPNGSVNPGEIIQKIREDGIDILIDLDSLTIPLHAEILYHQPAPICISWLGFDAPYISPHHYFLVDSYTHPEGRDKYYTEKLIRMPNSFVSVCGFARQEGDRVSLRQGYRIGLDQVVYLCVASGRKFNIELAKAHVAILKEVPHSILIYKGMGDTEVFQNTYKKICEEEGVGFYRIKFLERVATEEEHRKIYSLADVLLDSYPYNGGTHTLEALWFDLPVVTRVGVQFLSRMGYSFLQDLGINEGVATSWKEYIQWGVKLGKEPELRQQVVEKLKNSKKPENLAPLWNPQKFAQDFYEICQQLLEKEEG